MKIYTENIKFRRYVFVRNQPAFSIQTRRIEYTDITFCLEGKMTYYVNGEKIELNSGDAVVIPKNSERMRALSSTAVSYVSFNIYHDGEIKLSGLISEAIKKTTVYLLELFDDEWSSLSPFRFEKCATIFNYLYLTLLEAKSDVENQNIKQIKQYVENNISKNIRLDDIAELLHFAPQYVCKLFKTNTGMTITEYINHERIKLSRQEMITTNTPLFEIAEKVGFTNYNYFSNLFKRYTGASPSEYRKSILR